ncbi:MAG TPA: mechanosensitive ion channel domain-containing protein [Tepidisphaeraceae bacterium]|nr:mechanosensitive ion channel domain-containing protein [Tepidisphaeraceae bacterium]
MRRAPGRRGLSSIRGYQSSARQRLQRFRQGSMLAVALTAMILLLIGAPADAQDAEPVPQTQTEEVAEPAPVVPSDPGVGIQQATNTIRDLVWAAYGMLPSILIALLLIVLAWVAARVASALLHRTLRGWERTEAAAALVRIGLFLLAIAAGLSIVAGDARALLGSVGLVGLALSWALQTPIESFTGWLLNSFRAYYRVGDRIEVGEVFGDVYKIDVLTTTVWEAGGAGKSVAGAQPTGAMVTFPNWEVLRSNIINYSRDFPYVWDEITISITNESDLAYASEVIEATARKLLGPEMVTRAEQYQQLLERARLAFEVEELPRVFLSQADAWTNCTIRYLVPARQRRKWASSLLLAIATELAKPEHRGRLTTAYPRQEIQMRTTWAPNADADVDADKSR